MILLKTLIKYQRKPLKSYKKEFFLQKSTIFGHFRANIVQIQSVFFGTEEVELRRHLEIESFQQLTTNDKKSKHCKKFVLFVKKARKISKL